MYVRLRALIPKSEGKEVIMMLILHGGIVMLAALNLVVNTALGLMILLHYPYFMWPIPIRRPDYLREKPDLKTKEKGETEHEQSVD